VTGPSLVSPAPVQRVVVHDHPNPHKAARGQRKRTLESTRRGPSWPAAS